MNKSIGPIIFIALIVALQDLIILMSSGRTAVVSHSADKEVSACRDPFFVLIRVFVIRDQKQIDVFRKHT